MLAMTGILVQSFVRFPGFPPFPVSNAARPLAVFEGLWASEMKAVLLFFFVIGVLELTIGKQVSCAVLYCTDYGAETNPLRFRHQFVMAWLMLLIYTKYIF